MLKLANKMLKKWPRSRGARLNKEVITNLSNRLMVLTKIVAMSTLQKFSVEVNEYKIEKNQSPVCSMTPVERLR